MTAPTPTPTPTQIEAARKIAKRFQSSEDHAMYCAGHAFEAFADELTAAAGDPEIARLQGKINQAYSRTEDLLAILDNRPAAAEVGEPDAEAIEARWERKYSDAVRNIENRTIERCAQIVEKSFTPFSLEFLAAAIRELKDK